MQIYLSFVSWSGNDRRHIRSLRHPTVVLYDWVVDQHSQPIQPI